MECSSMVDVKTYKCFPTSIHEVKLNIETHDKTNMLAYIKNDGRDDDLHTMSYFKSLANKILECSEKILKDGSYEFEKIEITNIGDGYADDMLVEAAKGGNIIATNDKDLLNRLKILEINALKIREKNKLVSTEGL